LIQINVVAQDAAYCIRDVDWDLWLETLTLERN